ncbi:MAG TPA: class I SAM-dependent methyltransferase [Verrucomicrobiales bacterium]|nr:class I SAM-dependent methyltransferase [Verrucomicrobiales bacterium]
MPSSPADHLAAALTRRQTMGLPTPPAPTPTPTPHPANPAPKRGPEAQPDISRGCSEGTERNPRITSKTAPSPGRGDRTASPPNTPPISGAEPPIPETTIFRAVDGSGDALPGIFIDSCDGHWLVQTQDIPWPAWLEKTQPLSGWRSLWWKRLDQHAKEPPRLIAGEPPPQPFTVRELGLTYELDFRAGYSQGLFIDQRIQKSWVAATVRPQQRILNLFAYTCAFSVIAASRGAVTTSVDLSRPSLEWGKRNFSLNALDPAAHFFCKGDVAEWLRRFAAKDRTWHGIVLDPPTFSRNDKGRVFRVEKDFHELVSACLRLLEPGGWLLCSTNHRALSERDFLTLISRGAADAGRAIRCEPGAMPPDFTGEPYLKSVHVWG